MKNFINYYYHFYILDIHLYEGKYYFSYNGEHYVFKPCQYFAHLIDVMYELSKQLCYQNPFYHQFVYNKDHQLITLVDGKPFVMLKLSKVKNDPISIFDIRGNDYVKLDKNLESLNYFNWSYLWEQKIDYFEEIIFSKKSEYLAILPSFYYFVGLGENAILYIKEAIRNEEKDYMDQLGVAHRRFAKGDTLIDFYDPTNLIIDHKTRDIAEYIKSSFWAQDYDLVVIQDYLNKIELSKLGAHLLFGRLVFPSFYFDYLEQVLQNGNSEAILKLEQTIPSYQLFLSDICFLLKEKYQIQEINWLIKKM